MNYQQIPLSLYVHVPWCVRKCPYCDFNSHTLKTALPEKDYLQALSSEIQRYQAVIKNRPIVSIFFGGGTPSLLSGETIKSLLAAIVDNLNLASRVEITLEANPGTIDSPRFAAFRDAGINRLSLGIQSFQDDKLKSLGRIHDALAAKNAIQQAKAVGFDNFNLDLMFGLPHQTMSDAIFDLNTALSFEPPHLSWYQLTLEPNTHFYHHPPPQPTEDALFEMQEGGITLLREAGLERYEVSAFAKPLHHCVHNKNYWQFGDYLGIGPGAHSKLTQVDGSIIRFSQTKHPKTYLTTYKDHLPQRVLTAEDLVFEFMLNALRLTEGVAKELFTTHTGLPLSTLDKLLNHAYHKGLLIEDDTRLCPSEKGQRFLNDLISVFLPDTIKGSV